MAPISTGELVVSITALIAAMVTGALGYGFSSVTVPVALLFFPSKVLGPALVLVELATNVLGLILHRHQARNVARRMLPLLVGLLPGVALGAWVLSSTDGGPIKIGTYAVLLPLVVAQTAGLRWPLRREAAVAVPTGFVVGALYSATTISGPPVALFLNNQGLAQSHFRAAVYLIRAVESTATTIAYLYLGLFTAPSLGLASRLVPGLAIGLPLGIVLLRRIDAEGFRRISMAVCATIIAFGLSRSLVEAQVVAPSVAYVGSLAILGGETALLVRFFAARRQASSLEANRNG